MKQEKLVRQSLDPHAPLSAAVEAEIAALAADPNRPVDTSDIPPLGDDFWANAAKSPLYRPPARELTVRLDSDLLDWLARADGDVQVTLNEVLRRAMTREARKSGRSARYASGSES